MSRFAADFAACALPEHQREFGQEVTYQDPEVDPVEITAQVGDERDEPGEDDRGNETLTRTRTLTIGRDPDSEFGGVASPGVHATFLIGTEEWAIAAIESQTEAVSRLRCVFVSAMNVGRTGNGS